MPPYKDLLVSALGVMCCSPLYDHEWWHQAALRCLLLDRCVFITNRAGDELYMLRCWLSVPHVSTNQARVAKGGGAEFESGESQLLHWILKPDDTEALHDHPWDFETEILQGGYVEHTNTPQEIRAHVVDVLTRRLPGHIICKEARDFHAIGALIDGPGVIHPTFLAGGAWTCVRTAPRYREWGFMPPGKEWSDHRTYLKDKHTA